MMSPYQLTGEGIVGPEWIDNNGHVNMMWYTHLVDAATLALISSMGMDCTGEVGFVAARLSTAYRREMLLGDSWQIWSALVDMTDRSISCAHRIMSGTAIAARSDLTIVLFDRESRRSVPVPDALRASAEALLGETGRHLEE